VNKNQQSFGQQQQQSFPQKHGQPLFGQQQQQPSLGGHPMFGQLPGQPQPQQQVLPIIPHYPLWLPPFGMVGQLPGLPQLVYPQQQPLRCSSGMGLLPPDSVYSSNTHTNPS